MSHPEPVSSMDPRIKAALWFAEHGFGVFSVWSTDPDGTCRCPSRAACGVPGKHPITPNGFQDATTDAGRIRTMLAAASRPNYGLVCPEGVFAWDVDGEGWQEQVAALEAKHGPLPATLRVETRNGQHIYLRWPEGIPRPLHKMFGWVTRWGSGKMAGYVIGPRSIHASGKEYAPLGVFEIATLPEAWAKAALAGEAQSPHVIVIGAGDDPSTVQVGSRHDFLRDRARFYAGSIRDPDALFAAVWALNEKLPQPKDREAVQRAIGDALARFPADPVEQDPDTGEARVVRAVPDEGEILDDDARAPFPEPPARVAFEGTAGEIVASIIDGTDASETGILVSLLAMCGVLMPSRAYVLNRTHVSALHVCLVGDSSVGRKTTAMDRAQDAIKAMLGAPVVNRVVMTGMNSGEALVTTLERRQIDYKREPTTAIVYEEEYATLLSAAGREGSSLDSRLRVAFDGTSAMANRKQAGSQVVQPPYWLAALAGITPTELQEKAPEGVLRSGSANRWLWLPVVRREDGGDAPPEPPAALRRVVLDAHERAWAEPIALDVDPEVRRVLSAYDEHLRRTATGQAVDLALRFSTIATRVAMIHATLDRSSRVTVEHIRRGIALTEYAHEGVPWAWGWAVGDPLATYILRDLVESGSLTKRQVSQRWSRDQIRVQKAIDQLRRLRFVDTVKVRGTGGRPRNEVRLKPDHARFVRFDASVVPQPTHREKSSTTAQTPRSAETEQTHRTHKTSTNQPETATGEWLRPCRDYRGHHVAHRQTPTGWVCDTCDKEE